jgi:hypothetical protein
MGMRGLRWAYGDPNIVLSDALTSDSRMMIRRGIRDRLNTLAPFITWDADPYMVIGDDGRLLWIVDGYTSSEAHPYSRPIRSQGIEEFNYIRNSVKATVDAYDGEAKIYLFDDQDPLILAYQNLFPELFTPAVAMPADVRRHARSPEFLFRVQSEIYRTTHACAESFYNRADLWDIGTFTNGQGGGSASHDADVPGRDAAGRDRRNSCLDAYTPHNKQNLIGLMACRAAMASIWARSYSCSCPSRKSSRAVVDRGADQSESGDLQGSVAMEPAGLTSPARADWFPTTIRSCLSRLFTSRRRRRACAARRRWSWRRAMSWCTRTPIRRLWRRLGFIQRGLPPPVVSSTKSAPTHLPPVRTPADARIDTIRGHLDRYRSLSAQASGLKQARNSRPSNRWSRSRKAG